MKFLFAFFILTAFINIAFSQGVAINSGGANPDASAMMDISSSSKGILIPRIALTGTNDNTTISSPATSLLVYNTAKVSDVTPCYYYYNGSAWTTLGGNSSWKLNGNNISGTERLGTTSNRDLVIITNNQDILRISTKGQIEPLNTSSSVFIGEEAGENDDLSSSNHSHFVGRRAGYTNTTGNNNSAFGFCALYSNSTGNNNIAIGYEALRNNTTASNNCAIGFRALNNNQTGSANTALGYNSLYNNTATGNLALRDITTGNYNTAIGYNTGRGISTGNYNTIIGSQVTGLSNPSNNIIIADGQGNQRIRVVSSGNVGIGTTTIWELLDINGAMHLTPGSTPTIANEGDIYMDSGTHRLKYYNGTNWIDL